MLATHLMKQALNAGCAVQDLHLAKRYYDRAAATAPAAKWPVHLALFSLTLHAWCACTTRNFLKLLGAYQHSASEQQRVVCVSARGWLGSAGTAVCQPRLSTRISVLVQA